MEKSITLSISFLLIFFVSFSQDSLCVFKIEGDAYLKSKNDLRVLKKGMIINNANELTITSSSKIILINSEGHSYRLISPGSFSFKDILKNKFVENTESLTTKYFKLVWKELTDQNDNKTIIGGVFRGDILMQFPRDNINIASSSIKFSWDTVNEIDLYYLFIRNKISGEIFKIGINGNMAILGKNQPIFEKENDFEWMVSVTEFPNLKNSVFNSFKLITKKEYRTLMENFSGLVIDLKTLGLSDIEIETTLCKTYGVCN